jgi:hypothetical protein
MSQQDDQVHVQSVSHSMAPNLRTWLAKSVFPPLTSASTLLYGLGLLSVLLILLYPSPAQHSLCAPVDMRAA